MMHAIRGLAMLMATMPASAQVTDPTRPPTQMSVPDAAGAVAAPADVGVQTVILRAGGKSTAVINGQSVMVGSMVGDKRVVRITESEVVLKGSGGREVIKVIPGVSITPVKKATMRNSSGKTEK